MEMKGRIFLVAFILFDLIFNLSQAQLTTRFLKPCFEEDREREMNFCSDPKNDCTVEKLVQGESKLVRLDGVKVRKDSFIYMMKSLILVSLVFK